MDKDIMEYIEHVIDQERILREVQNELQKAKHILVGQLADKRLFHFLLPDMANLKKAARS